MLSIDVFVLILVTNNELLIVHPSIVSVYKGAEYVDTSIIQSRGISIDYHGSFIPHSIISLYMQYNT